MNILFIGYWSVNEGLTKSTIFPHLKILSDFEEVTRIVFTSIEREENIGSVDMQIKKCLHIPLCSKNIPNKLINKWYDFMIFPRLLRKIVVYYNVNFCIGAGTQAGALALKASSKYSIPFIVSYYDPHVYYMKELGVWKKYDPRYVALMWWENRIKKKAKALLPVSIGYKNELLKDGIPEEKLFSVPCSTNLDQFKLDPVQGIRIREKLGWSKKDIVGIYVGKFGEIYYKEKAFEWFKIFKSRYNSLRLIILTNHNKIWVENHLFFAGFMKEDFFVGSVNHDQVPMYLNAADFAFSLIKKHKYSFACSPVKNGEYWACGLPVIIPDGIGDDSEILKETGLGIVIEDATNIDKYIYPLEALIRSNRKEEIRLLAYKYRNLEIVKRTYKKILAELYH